MAAAFCTKCGGPVELSDRFCASCGTNIGEPAVETSVPRPPAAASPPGLSDTAALARFGRIARSVALLAFLLPWVTVSCAGQTIASVSGVRLATGAVTIRNPMSGAIETHAGSANWAVLVAAAAIVLG